MKNESFFKIYDWMIQDLKLTGNELLVYAIIFDCQERFKNANPSVNQISSRIGTSRSTTMRLLSSLENRKLIKIASIIGKNSTYSISSQNEVANQYQNDTSDPCQNETGVQNDTSIKMTQGVYQNDTGTGIKMTQGVYQNDTPLKEKKRLLKDLKDNNARSCACVGENKSSQTSTDTDAVSADEYFEIFWKLYPPKRKNNKESVREDFLKIPSEEYPMILSVLHHKLFDNELGSKWREADGKYILGIRRYLIDEYWKREENRCLVMFEYTPQGIRLGSQSSETLQNQLIANLKELKLV